jgi:hypothetical protein
VGTCRRHHRPYVVHPLFERGKRANAIRETGPALVEQDDPGELRQAAKEPCERRLGPGAFQVRHPPHHENEIDRSVADGLVGDVHVAAARVTGLRLNRDRRGYVTLGSCRRRGQDADVGDEPVASLVGRLDVPGVVRLVLERLPDLADADLERRVPDKHIRPRRVEQLLFRHEPARVLDQIEEDAVGLGRERHDTATARRQLRAGAIQDVRSDAQDCIRGLRKRLRRIRHARLAVTRET